MNVRAHDLTVVLRALLGSLPGATSLSVHSSRRWALVLVMVSSDEAVFALAEDLGLTCEIGLAKRRWRHRATSEQDRGTLRIDVVGPPHRGRPPGGGEGTGSP